MNNISRRIVGTLLCAILIEIICILIMSIYKLNNIGKPTPMPSSTSQPVVRVIVPSLDDEPLENRADEEDIEMIARVIWGEAENIKSKTEQAAVAWCILNRVDNNKSNIETEITNGQFHGYRTDGAVPSYYIQLAEDVTWRWSRERAYPDEDVGRILPKDYQWFWGDGQHNYFTNQYQCGDIWAWTLPTPYTEDNNLIIGGY